MSPNINNFSAIDLASFTHAVVSATRCMEGKLLWWRGQSKNNWTLHPSIYHKKMASNESYMSAQFRNQARVRHHDVPDISDGPSWAFLMQHYGLPTRLLDWSQSPLIALYFAVQDCEFDDGDAVVWGLLPTNLNKSQVGVNSVFGIGSPQVRPIFSNIWKNPESKVDAPHILAVNTQHVDVRQMVQASEFTIHGTDVGMNELPDSNQYLVSITIPGSQKKAFRQLLSLLHLTESYLFPDLEHLAKQIQTIEFSGE